MAEAYLKKQTRVMVNELTKENVTAVALWCGGVQVEEIDPHDSDIRYVGINVPTLHGMARASEGDFIIQGEAGDFWPCKPHVFRATYNKIE